jgi:hypothetical protein
VGGLPVKQERRLQTWQKSSPVGSPARRCCVLFYSVSLGGRWGFTLVEQLQLMLDSGGDGILILAFSHPVHNAQSVKLPVALGHLFSGEGGTPGQSAQFPRPA